MMPAKEMAVKIVKALDSKKLNRMAKNPTHIKSDVRLGYAQTLSTHIDGAITREIQRLKRKGFTDLNMPTPKSIATSGALENKCAEIP